MSLASRFVHLTDRSIIRVAGEGSGRFLQGLCSQDVVSLGRNEQVQAVPAAFLSPKGRLLCDTLVVHHGQEEFLLDCHHEVAKSLVRLLIRHRLREPLAIDDVSRDYRAIAALPDNFATSTTDDCQGGPDSRVLPPGFFSDPRFAALGHRAILQSGEQSPAPASGSEEAASTLSDYHLWRLCCAIPEGPTDMPPDTVLPLHANLDLTNFISFRKGCYVGQELTTRTKHRGAVRRRFFSVVAVQKAAAGEDSPQLALRAMQEMKPSSPLTPALLQSLGSPAFAAPPSGSAVAEAEERKVFAHTSDQDAVEGKQVGILHSSVKNIGLCLLRCEGSFNEAENFREPPLPANVQLTTDCGKVDLFLRAPPYAFL
eukprot:TRINITY_DN28749_c0_g1_i1.p1 TRINITY_DN28749_c0_g1~~TRINITY_DN28749_c0_g1_i1.p1  ORF type:complete len:370 (+),score=64.32 TRINITY_DN28749_c0_g1_i1:118-1227(+)